MRCFKITFAREPKVVSNFLKQIWNPHEKFYYLYFMQCLAKGTLKRAEMNQTWCVTLHDLAATAGTSVVLGLLVGAS